MDCGWSASRRDMEGSQAGGDACKRIPGTSEARRAKEKDRGGGHKEQTWSIISYSAVLLAHMDTLGYVSCALHYSLANETPSTEQVSYVHDHLSKCVCYLNHSLPPPPEGASDTNPTCATSRG